MWVLGRLRKRPWMVGMLKFDTADRGWPLVIFRVSKELLSCTVCCENFTWS